MKNLVGMGVIAGVACGVSACDIKDGYPGPAPDFNPRAPAMISTAPDDIGDGWATSSPAAEGVNEEVLANALAKFEMGEHPGVNGVVVVKGGRLIAEGYLEGFARESTRDMRSASKSITAILAAIAADQGALAIDEPIERYIPGFSTYANMDDDKRSITARHLLQMQGGLRCNDSDMASPGNEEYMYDTADWTKFALDLPMEHAPGVTTQYCTAGVVLLGDVVANAVGIPLEQFAAASLFDILGIVDVTWRRSPDGKATGGGGMRMRPRDIAKIGQLVLNAGTWEGQRVFSEKWAGRLGERVTSIDKGSTHEAYGYLWWKRAFRVGTSAQETLFAAGNGGNFIFVVPDADLVVTFSASNFDRPESALPIWIFSERILPAFL